MPTIIGLTRKNTIAQKQLREQERETARLIAKAAFIVVCLAFFAYRC